MEVEKSSLAYELLQEVKHSNKRLFILSIVELVIIISMTVGFLIYESQFDYSDETYTQETYDVQASNVTQTIN